MGRAFEYRKAAKEKRWGKMSLIFPKLSKSITVAAKSGGSDPDMNPKLRTAILNAKAENMPKANIDSAIKRATEKSANLEEISYEGRGPHGVSVFIDCLTDNPTRTIANLKFHFKKTDGEVLVNGSLKFMFDKKAIFEFEKTEDQDLEELELELIDAGLEEIEMHDNTVYVVANYTDFGTLNTALEEMKIEVTKATLEQIANNTKKYSEVEMEDINILIDRLEEDEDVQAVYTNVE
ncbi:MAG: FIG000859: hypothetical protein YebC [uncultured Campylobacterales bacterium]|uniref:Probable transcriptional regulatory protein HELGO_WM24332 n=1 Tax=uncultured Campylobacterales bacterium TaxID=352960 RepID=A0A6S6T6R8_9BACT|nr:MAG: FIG000859: hypothetical protein YebC [uncultured Campylobacterales bacterium]